MNQDHLFIELGVTNPNPRIGEIISVAACRTNYKGSVLAAFADKVRPDDAADCIEDNEYDELEWRDSVGLEDVMKGLYRSCIKQHHSDFVVVGYSDRPKKFLTVQRTPTSKHLLSRPWIDVQQLAWPFVYTDILPSRTLESLTKTAGIDNAAPNTAAGDCEAIVKVYWSMMDHYRLTLQGGEFIQDFSREAVSGVRKLFGL